jgi:hypothetical protein
MLDMPTEAVPDLLPFPSASHRRARGPFRLRHRQAPATPARQPPRDWGQFRWQDEVLTVLWLYNRNRRPRVSRLARLLHQQGYDWQT